MARFTTASGSDFKSTGAVGKYLADRLGGSYKFSFQSDELKSARAGSRGDLTRWVNEKIFGAQTIVVANNPLFGTAIRFYLKPRGSLLKVRGIIPNETLRKNVVPFSAIAVFFVALLALPAPLNFVVAFAWMPFWFLVPRLIAMPLTAKVTRFLADAEACRAAGIENPPVPTSGLEEVYPEQAQSMRMFGGAKILLGLFIAGSTTKYAVSQLGRPYSDLLWEDTLYWCSAATGFGLALAYVGVRNCMLRRVDWLVKITVAVTATGICVAAWAVIAPMVCPPRRDSNRIEVQTQQTQTLIEGPMKSNNESPH